MFQYPQSKVPYLQFFQYNRFDMGPNEGAIFNLLIDENNILIVIVY